MWLRNYSVPKVSLGKLSSAEFQKIRHLYILLHEVTRKASESILSKLSLTENKPGRDFKT